MLYFQLVPLRGISNLVPRPQNKILVPFRGFFPNIRWPPLSLIYGSTPSPLGMNAHLRASGKSIAASKPNLRWTPRSVLVREISLTLLQADLLSSPEILFGWIEDPERMGGSTGKRVVTSFPVRVSWEEPGGNPVCWLVELLT